MSSRRCRSKDQPSPEEIDQALAFLIANTKRIRRPDNLLEIAHWVRVACRAFGGFAAVAERTDLSEQMLRDFAGVEKLSAPVRRLVADREIDSVDIAARIARLPKPDQGHVARGVVSGAIDGNDVRAVLALRNDMPTVGIKEIVDRVVSTRDIKEYLVEFVAPSGEGCSRRLRARFERIVGKNNVRFFRVRGQLGAVTISSEGRRRLQAAATERGLTKRELVQDVIVGGDA